MSWLSRLFISAWLVPFAAIASQFVSFRGVGFGYVALIFAVPVVAWIFMNPKYDRARSPAPFERTKRVTLRRFFWSFILIAAAGNFLLLRSYAMSGVDLSAEGIQGLYLAVVSEQMEGSLSTGPLGTLAQLLRLAQPFALIFGVFLFHRERRFSRRALIGAAIGASIVYSYLASFSRGHVFFYAGCLALSAWCLPVPRVKLFVMASLGAFGGALFFATSASDRSAVLGVDQALQLEILEELFGFQSTPVSSVIVAIGGPQLLGLILYFTASLIEGARLLIIGVSPMFMGALTFYPYVHPFRRMLGLETNIDETVLVRANAWYSAIGDLYLDFGQFGLVVFVFLAILMYRLATNLKNSGVWGQVHYIITGVFFMLFPLYSAFHSYGLIYAASLGLAIWAQHQRRQLAAERTKSGYAPVAPVIGS